VSSCGWSWDNIWILREWVTIAEHQKALIGKRAIYRCDLRGWLRVKEYISL